MHKKLEAELVSLAHSILERKNNDDVADLHKKAQGICEKLSVLKFVDAYINDTPETIANEDELMLGVKESIIEEVVEVVEEQVDKVTEIEPEIRTEKENSEVIEEIVAVVEENKEVVEKLEAPEEMLTPKQVEVVFGSNDNLIKDDVSGLTATQFTLEEELKDAISSDIATDLFEKATKENPVVKAAKETSEPKKKSLNDSVFSGNLQIGLNDRIAFVKHLFEGSQEDFNRVLSQLNSFKSEEEAKTFFQEFVKLDYDWSAKEEYEERFLKIIERKFL